VALNEMSDGHCGAQMTYRKSLSLFGTVGAVVAVCLIAYAGYITSRGIAPSGSIDWVYVGLCPTSLGLIGTERLSVIGRGLAYTFIVLTNSLIYATAAWLISSVVYPSSRM
jgi:hypothetical protein